MFGYKLLDISTAIVVAVVFVISLNLVGSLVLGPPHEEVAMAPAGDGGESESAAAEASGEEQQASAGGIDPAKGGKLFKKCKACHNTDQGSGHKSGPNLYGVVGRAAGAAEGFNYSSAMVEAGLTWDVATLDKFLADPKGMVSGTKMAFKGVSDANDRANLIAYLNGFGGSATMEPAASEEKPAEQAAAEEKPAEEKPAEEKPAEEKPAEEKPVEQAAAEEKPAEEKPVEQAAAATGGDAAAGEKVFKKCKACHSTDAGAKHRSGPNLFGVVGRAAGSADGFKYSDAMAGSGLTWDEATLDKFLTDPKGMVNGTKMSYKGLNKAEDRADLISYLKSLK